MANFPSFLGIREISEREGTLLLHVPDGLAQLPGETIRLPEGRFLPKEELHITVVGRDSATLLQRAGVTTDTLRRHAARVTWTIHPRNVFWLVEAPPKPGYTEKRRSIIQMVDVPNLEAFLDTLAESCGIRLPTPPAHMTWFTQNWSHGIGLDAEDEFRERRVRPLSDSEIARLRDDFTRRAGR